MLGLEITLSDNTGTMALFHDPLGRVSAKYTAIQGLTYLINYTYDAAGNLAEIKMPDGRRIDYSYDSAGEVTAVSTRQTAASTPVVLANNFSVLPFGPIKGWTFGNAVVHAVSYDEGYRVETVLDQGSASILDLDYSYDANHNIDGLANGVNSALSQSFSFDERDRLDTASGAYGAYDYDYDLAGNRTQFTRAGYSETFTLSPGSHRLDSISVDDNGVTSQRTLSYDNAGNTTADSRGYSYGYGQNNRLILAGGPHGGAWLYTNAQGQRVITQPTSAGIAPRHYLYDAAGELVMESHGVTGEVLKHYIRLGGQLLAILSQGTNATGQPTAASLYYVHSDHLGTPQALTDQSGQVVWSIAYDPFGQATVNEDPDGDGTSIEFNLRFPGQYYDKYSGVNYNYYRDYDPTTGRYIQSDPIGLHGGLNTFAYVGSNPLIRVDPLGLTTIHFYPGTGIAVVDPNDVSDPNSSYYLPATSGDPDCGCDATIRNKGPIPQGSYTGEANQLTDPGLVGDILRNFAPRDGRIGADWGDWRMPLAPDSNTKTHGRTGFYIHGGQFPGSAGCIDVGGGLLGNTGTDRLKGDILNDPDGIIPVIVH